MTMRLLTILGGLCLLLPGICATPNFHFEPFSAVLLAIVGLMALHVQSGLPVRR
jgi:hypothetical protein